MILQDGHNKSTYLDLCPVGIRPLRFGDGGDALDDQGAEGVHLFKRSAGFGPGIKARQGLVSHRQRQQRTQMAKPALAAPVRVEK